MALFGGQQQMKFITAPFVWLDKFLSWLAPIADLIIRFWIFKVFFLSALTKIKDFNSTTMLFQYEYQVPGLHPTVAAYLGTGIELVMPILILIGLGSRIPAFILFVFNIIAVISYPFLFTEAGSVGLMQHVLWGLLIMMIMTHGHGCISLDAIIKKCFLRKK